MAHTRRLVERSVEIAKPASDVFEYVADLENYPFWFPGIAQMRAQDGRRPCTVGKRYSEIAHLPGGKEERIEVEVVECDPGRRMVIDADLKPALPRFEYRVEEISVQRSRFVWAAYRRARGLGATLVHPLMVLVLRDRARRAVANLKRILEARPETIMAAAVLRRFGPAAEVLAFDDRHARPSQRNDEILVRQLASSLNPIDVARRNGYGRSLLKLRGAANFPIILGNDVCGIVSGLGNDVKDFAVGERVFGAKPPSSNGTFAEYVAVKAAHVVRSPAGAAAVQCAAAPYVFQTAWEALVESAGVSEETALGKKVFVRGGGGSVGSMVVQLASSWGAQVFVSCSSKDFQWARRCGAVETFDYRQEDIPSGLDDFDVVINCAPRPHHEGLLSMLKKGTGAVYVTTVHPTLELCDQHGVVKGMLKARKLKRRAQAQARSEGRRLEWMLFKPSRAALQVLQQLLERQALEVRVGSVFPLCHPIEAHMEAEGGGAGKVLIEIEAGSLETGSTIREGRT